MPGVGWLTGILLSVPDEGPSGGGEDEIKNISKYRSPESHSEYAHSLEDTPKPLIKLNIMLKLN